ncbi:MAG: DNA-binding protein WhiA [Clostridiales bacterium]|nr:DNA-binding protein WhiA [Clostridiales bacterium]
MSFSSSAKSELCRIRLKESCCRLAELAAFIYLNGTILFSGNGKVRLYLTTENVAVARRMFMLIRNLYSIHPGIYVRKNRRLRKNNVYMVSVLQPDQAEKILKDAHVLYTNEVNSTDIYTGIYCRLIEKECCKRAYLRGAFLATGSISDPRRTYHLEITTRNQQYAMDLLELMQCFDMRGKSIERKGNYVVYLKESENIVYFLNVVGAHGALLELENIRVRKDMRNSINRLVNCETANLEKTVNAALRHIENIKLIDECIGLNKLSPSLREIAELRLKYTDASLKELGEMLIPPIGKSGVNHRLRKLDRIADDLRRKGEI